MKKIFSGNGQHMYLYFWNICLSQRETHEVKYTLLPNFFSNKLSHILHREVEYKLRASVVLGTRRRDWCMR